MNCLFCNKVIDGYCFECSVQFYYDNMYRYYFNNKDGSYIAEFNMNSNYLAVYGYNDSSEDTVYNLIMEIKFERLLNPQEIEEKFKSLLIFT